MRRVIIILLSSLFVLHSSFSRAQTVSEVTPLAGEKWWGVFAGNSPGQPFAEPFEANTALMNGGGFYTPYMISTAGRYVRGGEGLEVFFDGRKFTIMSSGERVYVEKSGRTLRQAYLGMHHRDFKGTEKFPSKDLFTEIIYETQADFGFLQTADDILAYARRLIDEGFPPGIIVLADGWRVAPEHDFDKRHFPMPASFVADLHRLGFKVMLTITPYVQAWGRDYAMLERDGALVADPGGSPFVMGGAAGHFVAVDWTDPMRLHGLRETLSGLRAKYGVDGFRFDCHDVIETISGDAEYARGYLAAVREAGAEFALAEFWPGTPGFQADYVSVVRTRKTDEDGCLLDAVTAGIAAGPFTQVVPDAGFFFDDRTFVRHALMQLMMPVARVPFSPWKYGFAEGEIRRVLDFRASAAQYMGKMFGEACKTVEPIIRPMECNFPNSGFADCADQYMLGDRYLVAPALDDGSKRLVRLPKGNWRDMNGRKYKGPLVIEAETDGYRMTWFELQ